MGIGTLLEAVGELGTAGAAALSATQERKQELRALAEDAMRRYLDAFDSLPAAMAANDAAADAALAKRFPAPPAAPALTPAAPPPVGPVDAPAAPAPAPTEPGHG